MLVNLETSRRKDITEASLDHVAIWRRANKLYPQSQNGFAGILGPHIIKDMFNLNMTVESMGKMMIPKDELDSIINEADSIHGRLGIICEVASGSVNQQWRATGLRILSVLRSQIYEIAIGIGDMDLLRVSEDKTFPNKDIEYFIADTKYSEERKLVQSMWDIASDMLQSSSSKKRAANITKTLIAMHIDMILNRFGLDLRQGNIIGPEWELIRRDLVMKLECELQVSINFNSEMLFDRFALNLIRGNKPQVATRKPV